MENNTIGCLLDFIRKISKYLGVPPLKLYARSPLLGFVKGISNEHEAEKVIREKLEKALEYPPEWLLTAKEGIKRYLTELYNPKVLVAGEIEQISLRSEEEIEKDSFVYAGMLGMVLDRIKECFFKDREIDDIIISLLENGKSLQVFMVVLGLQTLNEIAIRCLKIGDKRRERWHDLYFELRKKFKLDAIRYWMSKIE